MVTCEQSERALTVKLPKEWKGEALVLVDEPGAPNARPEDMIGKGTAHNPPDPYDGWTDKGWKESDNEHDWGNVAQSS